MFMGSREFRQMVFEDGTGVPAWTLEAASAYFIQQARIRREDVEECVRLAQLFAKRQHAADAAMGFSSGPALAISSSALVDVIRQSVEALRQALFSRTKAPFSSCAGAARWINREAPKPRRLSRRQWREAEDLHVDIELKSQRLGVLLGRTIVNSEAFRSLPYVTRDKRAARVNVIPGTKLAELEERSRRLAIATGFPQEAIVSYTLTGEAPALSAVRVTTTYRRLGERSVQPKSVAIETYSRDVTSAGLRSAHGHIRRALNVKRVKPLTRDHEELVQLVSHVRQEGRKHGRETNRAFWERVRSQWNQRHPERPYRTWRGLEMRYARLRKTVGLPRVLFRGVS